MSKHFIPHVEFMKIVPCKCGVGGWDLEYDRYKDHISSAKRVLSELTEETWTLENINKKLDSLFSND